MAIDRITEATFCGGLPRYVDLWEDVPRPLTRTALAAESERVRARLAVERRRLVSLKAKRVAMWGVLGVLLLTGLTGAAQVASDALAWLLAMGMLVVVVAGVQAIFGDGHEGEIKRTEFVIRNTLNKLRSADDLLARSDW